MAGRGRRVRPLVAACLYYSGLIGLVRWWTQLHGPRLLILNYHRASHPNLRRQLLYLRQHYRLLPLETALQELYEPQHARAHAPTERRTPLAITFDDGYRDNYTHAAALARELQIPITVFLVPGYIESGSLFWWLEAECLARTACVREATIDGRTYHLENKQERQVLAQAIDARVRHAATVAEREAFLAVVRETLASSSSMGHEDQLATPLTWGEVREMATSGWVSFGAHTQHHPVLAYLADAAEVAREVGDCRQVLEGQLSQPVWTFAYPIGRPEHIGPKAPKAVRQAGYRWALTTLRGVNTPQTDPYLLRRVGVDHDEHWLVTAARVAKRAVRKG